jgi:hypothetical protein
VSNGTRSGACGLTQHQTKPRVSVAVDMLMITEAYYNDTHSMGTMGDGYRLDAIPDEMTT